MRKILTARLSTQFVAQGLFIITLILAGCTTLNCTDCDKCGPDGPADCAVTQILVNGHPSGCANGSSMCTNSDSCGVGKKCKTVGHPNCYCSCRR